jgi:hypothetical protein
MSGQADRAAVELYWIPLGAGGHSVRFNGVLFEAPAAIPDLDEAVDSPRILTTDPAVARRMLALIRSVPMPVWGRDELGAGEMWNSNSVAAWVTARAGLPTDELRPPPPGRTPGWDSGLAVAEQRAGHRRSRELSRNALRRTAHQ